MDISFKGLQNTTIAITKGKSSSGNIKMQAYRLVTNLTNDDKGAHFDNFYKQLDKLGKKEAWQFIPKDYPEDQIIFDISKFEFNNKEFMPPQINFMLNNQNLELDNDRVLGLFSFLAKSISFIKNGTNNPDYKKVADKMNNIIEEAVVDYIG